MDQTIQIADDGEILSLDYDGLVAFHNGDALWGCSAGFRALQAAGQLLSAEQLWDRDKLSVATAHPGPGVRDAVEYVTHCVSRERFRLSDPAQYDLCGSGMEFAWWVSNHRETAEIRLPPEFVPEEFYELLDIINANAADDGVREKLETLKLELTQQLWQLPLQVAFETTLHPGLVAPTN